MPHFFISYAKKDTRELALALNAALNSLNGVSAWVDQSLRAGQSWELQIQAEIDRCDFMVVLLSPDVNRHQAGEEESYVLTEVGYAKRTLKKPLLPVMAQKTTLPIALTNDHYIDFTGAQVSLEALVATLLDAADFTPVTPFLLGAERIRAIIGDPFAWCEVPKGPFLVGEKKKPARLERYAISQHPITYQQFQAFLDDPTGYSHPTVNWFAGLAASPNERPPKAQFFKLENHPRETVNWYQALAFCRWLGWRSSETAFDPLALSPIDDPLAWPIRLPTDPEWEKAGRGTDGRDYAWGNDFDLHKCNTEASKTNQTTAVTAYPYGMSPYGALDMCGNVWEWCLTDYQSSKNTPITTAAKRVLHGGSWDYAASRAKLSYRIGLEPYLAFANTGFRIVWPIGGG